MNGIDHLEIELALIDIGPLKAALMANLISENLRIQIEKIVENHNKMVRAIEKHIEEQIKIAEELIGIKPEEGINPQASAADNEDEGKQVSKPGADVKNEADKKSRGKKYRKKRKKLNTEKKKRSCNGKRKLPLGTVIFNALSEAEKICPGCKNKMHMQKSLKKTLVVAVPTLSTETYIRESCRCIYCDTTATAEVTPRATAEECIGRYHMSSVALIAALRYQYGMASYRIGAMCDIMGIPIPDSTQWHLFDQAATILSPFVDYLITFVANTDIYHTDDTHNRVIELRNFIYDQQEKVLDAGKDIKSVRSGINTTNVVGTFDNDKSKKIVLYFTGIHHAGEVLANIMQKRKISTPITVMADASSNTESKLPSKNSTTVQMANCNSHAVRKFIELIEKEEKVAVENGIKNYEPSDILSFFVSKYGEVFKNDEKSKDMNMIDRLEFHKKNSLPIMSEMLDKINCEFEKKSTEPNSDLGRIFKYFKNHHKELCAFCEYAGAPICNNISERMLKHIIRHRKNSLFYKNSRGAAVGDIFDTLLFTAKENDISSIDYLRDLLLYQQHWSENPDAWLPWRYKDTIANIKNSQVLQA